MRSQNWQTINVIIINPAHISHLYNQTSFFSWTFVKCRTLCVLNTHTHMWVQPIITKYPNQVQGGTYQIYQRRLCVQSSGWKKRKRIIYAAVAANAFNKIWQLAILKYAFKCFRHYFASIGYKQQILVQVLPCVAFTAAFKYFVTVVFGYSWQCTIDKDFYDIERTRRDACISNTKLKSLDRRLFSVSCHHI